MKVRSQPLQLETGLSCFKKRGKPFTDVAPAGGLNLESSLVLHLGLGCVLLLSGPPARVVGAASQTMISFFSMILLLFNDFVKIFNEFLMIFR